MTKATHKCSCGYVSRVVSPRELHTPKPVTLVSPSLARHKGQDFNAFADDIVIFFSASEPVGERWVKQLLLPPTPRFKSQPPAAEDILLAGAAGRPQLLVPVQFTHHHSEDLGDVTLSLSATA